MKKKFSKIRFYLINLIVVGVLDAVVIHCLEIRIQQETSFAKRAYQYIYDEIKFFPIADSGDEELSYDFVDSWMADRTFGGERRHEGCDIITTVDQRGMYPVVSMCDGTVEKIGWLKLGGYRIGIRSEKGTYFYYAHMESYAENLAEGDTVNAGQFLGFVGDSGYGDEGTTGQFVVHLHLGIYVPNENGEDEAIDPYPFLDSARDNKIQAEYTKP